MGWQSLSKYLFLGVSLLALACLAGCQTVDDDLRPQAGPLPPMDYAEGDSPR